LKFEEFEELGGRSCLQVVSWDQKELASSRLNSTPPMGRMTQYHPPHLVSFTISMYHSMVSSSFVFVLGVAIL